MAEFQIITKSDLDGLNLSKSVQDVILQGVDIERMSILDLEQMVNNLVTLLEKVMKQNQTNRAGKIGYSYSFAEMRKSTFRQITMVGALLVFKIRQFLLQEPITFSLGATDDNGKLYERQITQDELFQRVDGRRQRLRSSLSSHAIMLSRSLEKFNAQDFQEVGSLNLWPTILQLAFEGPAVKNSGDDFETGDTDYYQKDSVDKEVYIRYTEGRKQTKQYYYGKNEMKYFNKGWLYEWYMEYISANPDNELKLAKSLQNNSLRPIMKGMDATPGYKGGDYIAQGQQMQAKYNNQQMITYVSIIKVLTEIKTILFGLHEGVSIEQMSKQFVELFTDDSTVVERLNNTYSNVVNEQLLKLFKT